MLEGRFSLHLPTRPGVPQIMEAEAGQPGRVASVAPGLGGDLLDRRAAPEAEDVLSVVLWVVDPLREHDKRIRIERDNSRVIRLGIRGRHERGRPLQIDVSAFELRDLRSAHSGGAGKDSAGPARSAATVGAVSLRFHFTFDESE
jgi:hypothetical protein